MRALMGFTVVVVKLSSRVRGVKHCSSLPGRGINASFFAAEITVEQTQTNGYSMRRPAYPFILIAVGCFMSGCSGDAPITWQRIVAERLPKYGHRNWILIADAAYPSQGRPGVETITTNEDHLKVLGEVLRMVGNMKHVRARPFVDKELAFVAEGDVPGISAYRDALRPLLGTQAVDTVLHEDLISRIDEASRTFDVLILKTDLTLPYTSVFLELGCAYWSDGAESRLRESMKTE